MRKDCGGCGKRAVWGLKKLGYVQDGDVLRKGELAIPIAEAEEHHTQVTVDAIAEKARAWVQRLRTPAP